MNICVNTHCWAEETVNLVRKCEFMCKYTLLGGGEGEYSEEV